jgi:hypothetical protein
MAMDVSQPPTKKLVSSVVAAANVAPVLPRSTGLPPMVIGMPSGYSAPRGDETGSCVTVARHSTPSTTTARSH